MSTPNKRKKLTESLLGTTYEREDLMRQEVRARRLARRRRREEERSAEGAQRGSSLVSKLGRAVSSLWRQ
jgi:predicted transposase YdaD